MKPILWLALAGVALAAAGCRPSAERPPDAVVVSISGGPPAEAGLRRVVAAYERLHPQARVKLELKGGGTGVGYETWLATQLASGAPRPDIVSSNYAPGYAAYVNFDLYRELVNPHNGRAWERDLDFDFYQGRNGRGERFCLATQSVKVTWYYNVDEFARLGLRAPETWAELIQLFADIRRAGKIAHTIKFNFAFHQWLAEILWDQFTRPLIAEVRAQPGDWCFRPEVDGAWRYDPADPFNDAGLTINYARLFRAYRDGVIRFDCESFRAVLRALKQVADAGPPGFATSTASDVTEAYNQFLRQEALIHFDGSWADYQLVNDMTQLAESGRSFRWGKFETPGLAAPAVQAPPRAVESAAGEYLGVVYKNQPQVDATMDFLRYWLSREGYQQYVDGAVAAGTFNPSGRIMIAGVELPEKYRALPPVALRGNAETPLNLLFQVAPQGSRARRDLLRLVAEYLDNHRSAEATATELQRVLDAALPEILASQGLKANDLDHPERRPAG